MLGDVSYTKRAHPLGEAGIRTSLREVALGMGRGKDSREVLRWSRNVIEDARIKRGFRADTERKRAELLLAAVQEKVWTPDPVGSEFMASSRLLACDLDSKEHDCFATGDCDDKSRLLGSAFLSVGLHAVALGISQRKDRQIHHVLNAVRVDGRWLRADGSTQQPLGESVQTTREVVVEPITGNIICDSDDCFGDGKKLDFDLESYVESGTFVGVDGARVRKRAPLVLLGQVDEYKQCASLSAEDKDAKVVFQSRAGCVARTYCGAVGPQADICEEIGSRVAGWSAEGLRAGTSVLNEFLSTSVKHRAEDSVVFQRLAKLHNDLLPGEPKWTARTVQSDWMKRGWRKSGALDPLEAKLFQCQLVLSKQQAADCAKARVALAQRYADLSAETAADIYARAGVRTSSGSNVLPVVAAAVVIGGALWLLL